MAKVLYGALNHDGDVYPPNTPFSKLSKGAKAAVKGTSALVDERDHPYYEEVEEDEEVEDDVSDNDEE